MIVIWDDHEYSNDCWGDEHVSKRQDKRSMEPAVATPSELFEYMPIDDSSPMSGSSPSLIQAFTHAPACSATSTLGKTFTWYHGLSQLPSRSLIPEEAYRAAPRSMRRTLWRLGLIQIFEFDDGFAAIDIDAPLYARQKTGAPVTCRNRRPSGVWTCAGRCPTKSGARG